MFFKKKPCLNLEEKTYVNDKYIYKKKIARQNTAQPFGIYRQLLISRDPSKF